MKRNIWCSRFGALTIALGLPISCGDNDKETENDTNNDVASAGEETGPCFPNETCNAGLMCLSSTCVDPGSGDPDSGDPGSGDPDSGDEAGAGNGEPNPGANDGEGGVADDGGNADSGDNSGEEPDSGDNPSTGEACDEPNDTRGSCVTDDLQYCNGEEWEVADCAGCGIVAPSKQCEHISVVTFQRSGNDVSIVEGEVRDVTVSKDRVSAEWLLEAEQFGAIQLRAASTVDISRVKIEGSTANISLVTVEVLGGESGCQYEVGTDGRLMRAETVDWNGCWGDFETLDTTEPTTGRAVSIRTRVSLTNDIIKLDLTQILL